MRIAIGCDHRGIEVKELIKRVIAAGGHEVKDCGACTEEPVDYPDIAAAVGGAILSGECQRGVLICGTGIGMSIAANKIKGIRAALCHNAFTAMRARRHNDAQICCIGAEEGKALAPAVIETFLTTEFEGGRHAARLEKIAAMEEG